MEKKIYTKNLEIFWLLASIPTMGCYAPGTTLLERLGLQWMHMWFANQLLLSGSLIKLFTSGLRAPNFPRSPSTSPQLRRERHDAEKEHFLHKKEK